MSTYIYVAIWFILLTTEVNCKVGNSTYNSLVVLFNKIFISNFALACTYACTYNLNLCTYVYDFVRMKCTGLNV